MSIRKLEKRFKPRRIALIGVGRIATDAAYLLPRRKAVGNRIKPGCAEPAIINGLLEMMREFLGTRR
jgi:hypothetical protein